MTDPQWHYFRVQLDFATLDPALAATLRADKGSRIVNEPLAQRLNESVKRGRTELDGVSNIEDHGSSG